MFSNVYIKHTHSHIHTHSEQIKLDYNFDYFYGPWYLKSFLQVLYLLFLEKCF